MAQWSEVSRLVRLSAAVVVCLAAPALGAEPAPPPEPTTYLCDAPEPTGAIARPGPLDLSGWTRLAEDDKAHAFRGCPVLLNDRMVAVLEPDTAVLAVYSRRPQGTRLCARLQPVCAGRVDLKRTALAIRENTRSSVALAVTFGSPAEEPRQVTYELTAGAPFIKTTAAAGVEKLRVHAPCRFAVLPDFFGDDIVIDAAALPAALAQAEIPSENFLLHMQPGGAAIVMTVSETRDRDAVVNLAGAGGNSGTGAARAIASSDIAYGSKPHIWVALLADPGIWHQRTILPADAGQVLKLDWQMPFAALWRVDWSKPDRLTESWETLLQDPAGKYVMLNWFGQREAEGQSFGAEFGPRDWNKPDRQRWNPVLGAFKFPCWIDNDRQGYFQPLEPRNRKEGAGPVFVGPAVIYPLDRAQTAPFATPLDKLTVVDLVRATLGVGPCQYILDLEGQKRNSRGVATCYARDVINAIYKEGSQLRQGPAIEEHLDLCVAFIRNVRERIDQYVQFGHELTAYLEEQKRLQPRHAVFINELLGVAKELDRRFEEKRAAIRTPADAQQQAERFRAELLKYTSPDAAQKCATQMAVFTSIGGAQDDLVASCRMIVKTLRQRAGIAMAVNPELKGLATEIRQRTQAILRNPTAYEAPRH